VGAGVAAAAGLAESDVTADEQPARAMRDHAEIESATAAERRTMMDMLNSPGKADGLRA
jgi:hypothetical protein